jgi:hypothetical protein
MIIGGDVAVAPGQTFRLKDFPPSVLSSDWVINLEGAILNSIPDNGCGVFNSRVLLDSFRDIRITGVSLANNHIFDFSNDISATLSWAEKHGITPFGAGPDPEAASTPYRTNSSNGHFSFLAFGWRVIGCPPVSKHSPGVNELNWDNVIGQARDELCKSPSRKLVVILHTNFEFEPFPHPLHRELAKALIDQGTYSVIFHHPHVVGPIEVYRGQLIAYSLGNLAFSQNYFYNGKLSFPEVSNTGILIEHSIDGDFVHHYTVDKDFGVRWLRAESANSDNCSIIAPFQGFNEHEYVQWFKTNRVKRRLLPIYKTTDGIISTAFKDKWVRARDYMIRFLLLMGAKTRRPSFTPPPRSKGTCI